MGVPRHAYGVAGRACSGLSASARAFGAFTGSSLAPVRELTLRIPHAGHRFTNHFSIKRLYPAIVLIH
ncbi:MAG TPA: hypothetical protein PLL93_07055, partial [bacterium]|nr:hypothetical protein [bacterium]